MKYEHTYLSVRVTATGNTAREMSRWSDAARTEYLCDQAVLFLNGKRPDLFVEVVDLKAVELQRAQNRAMTGSDFVGGAVIEIEKPDGTVEQTTADEVAKRAPAPQAGEWPKWRHGGGIGGRGVLLHFESEHVATRYRRGCKPDARSGNLYRWSQNSHLAVSRDYAIGWLRENGHAKVADELEGEGRGEWPRWTKYRTRVIRYDADTSGVEYHPFIAPFRNVSAVFGFAARTECGSELEITEAEALSWLRSNGNEAEAAKLEGDRFEPVGLCRS